MQSAMQAKWKGWGNGKRETDLHKCRADVVGWIIKWRVAKVAAMGTPCISSKWHKLKNTKFAFA